MGKLFEIAPGINRSRIFDLSDEEINALDEESLRRLKSEMTVKYRINVLRARGLFVDDYIFAMNDRRAKVDSALLKYDMYRQSKTHPLLFKGKLGAIIRHQLAQAEAELTVNDPLALPGSPRLARQMVDRGLTVNSKIIDVLEDAEDAIDQYNRDQKEN